MPTFKIDGKEVPFQDGDTILRAAHREGIEIPHYCWHPGLSVAANCRMCLVEIAPPAGRPALTLEVIRWDPEKQDYVPQRKPKLQPACQVPAAEGLDILNDSSPHVIQARAAVQEFLLLNHPVDCPICDQAGECRLQDYWLEHQHKPKRMNEEIVHKPKATVFGPTIVYDAERCIMCTRCVRFCKEVANDPVLSVSQRGNIDEIVVSPGRQLDHAYTLMTEFVCPVGALTARDFRFKARVWFLRSAKTICQGCATGCNSFLDYDPRYNKAYRKRPRENQEVNAHWMCDEGVLSYDRIHKDRITESKLDGKVVKTKVAFDQALAAIRTMPQGSTAVVLSAQHSNEDNFALVNLMKNYLGIGDFYLAGKAQGDGDTILRHVDKNPNTLGATQTASTTPPRAFDELLTKIESREITHVLALGSAVPTDPTKTLLTLKRLKSLVTVGVWDGPLANAAKIFLPACSHAEAEGTFTNAKGIPQRSERALNPIGDAQPAWSIFARVGESLGHPTAWKKLKDIHKAMAPEAGAIASAAAEP